MALEQFSPSEKPKPSPIRDFFESTKIEKIVTVEEIDKVLVHIDTLRKNHKTILGDPEKSHALQDPNTLKNIEYWNISNIIQLLELKKEVLTKNLKSFHGFTGGGSIGVGYLGNMLHDYEIGQHPDVIFGYSAGSLFPALFLLYKKANEVNPDKAKKGLDGIFDMLPKNLDQKTMFSNGAELIGEFKTAAQRLIDVINEKLPDGEKMDNIETLSIEKLSPYFKIIASRKTKNGTQRVIFGGKDGLLNSIIGSSSPEISLLGLKFNVLGADKNQFYANEWIDGWHSGDRLMSYNQFLGLTKTKQYATLYQYADGITSSDYFHKDFQSFVLTNFTPGYQPLDQNSNWGIDDMKLKVIMGYYKYLSLSNIGYFLEDLEKDITSRNMVQEYYNLVETNDFVAYSIGDPRMFQESIMKIQSLKSLNPEKKAELIMKIFYYKHTNILQKNSIPPQDMIDSAGDNTSDPNKAISYRLKNKYLSGLLPDWYNAYGQPQESKQSVSHDDKVVDYLQSNPYKADNTEEIIVSLTTKGDLIRLMHKTKSNGAFFDLFMRTNIINDITNEEIVTLLLQKSSGYRTFEKESMQEHNIVSLSTKLREIGRVEDFRQILSKLQESGELKSIIDELLAKKEL